MIKLLVYVAVSMIIFCSELSEPKIEKRVSLLHRKFFVKLLSIENKDLQQSSQYKLQTNIHYGMLSNGFIVAPSSVIIGLAGTADKLLAYIDGKYYTAHILINDPAIGLGILSIDDAIEINDEPEYKAADVSGLKEVKVAYINDEGCEMEIGCSVINKPSVLQIRQGIYGNCLLIDSNYDIPVGALVFNDQQESIGMCIKIEDRVDPLGNIMTKYQTNTTRVVQLFDRQYLDHMGYLLKNTRDGCVGKCPYLDIDICDLKHNDLSDSIKHGIKVIYSDNAEIKSEDIITEINGSPVTNCRSFVYSLQLIAPWSSKPAEMLNNISLKLIRNNVELLLDVPAVYREISHTINVHHAVFNLIETKNNLEEYPYGLRVVYINLSSVLYNILNKNDIVVAINDRPIHGRQDGIAALNILCNDLTAKRKCKVSILGANKELRVLYLGS
jgi:hypothetical protein